jgi:CheY-like chemotaxis protein
MISKNLLLTIPELNLRERVDLMTDHQYISYVQSLNSFVDKFPSMAEKLKKALDMSAHKELADDLEGVCDALTKIHADGLAKECRAHVAAVKASNPATYNYNSFEAFVEGLIQRISTMSIETRMAAHRSAAGAQHPGGGSGYSGKEALILAVDNAVMFLKTLQKILRDEPYDMHCLTSCAEALDFLERNAPDAILLDVEMPEMDGYELARRIKGSGQKAPILFITAHYADEYVDQAIEVGAAGLLMKPIDPKQLRAKLKEVLQ